MFAPFHQMEKLSWAYFYTHFLVKNLLPDLLVECEVFVILCLSICRNKNLSK